MLQTYNDENDCILTSQKMSLNENGFDNGQNKDFLDLKVASYVPSSIMISALLAVFVYSQYITTRHYSQF